MEFEWYIPPSVGMSENDVCPQMAIIIGRIMISSDKPMCLWSSIVITVFANYSDNSIEKMKMIYDNECC